MNIGMISAGSVSHTVFSGDNSPKNKEKLKKHSGQQGTTAPSSSSSASRRAGSEAQPKHERRHDRH